MIDLKIDRADERYNQEQGIGLNGVHKVNPPYVSEFWKVDERLKMLIS